jgi:hypothetical protein
VAAICRIVNDERKNHNEYEVVIQFRMMFGPRTILGCPRNAAGFRIAEYSETGLIL